MTGVAEGAEVHGEIQHIWHYRISTSWRIMQG